MKELQVEDEEEERFQADLKMAVRQSLGIIFTSLYIHMWTGCCYHIPLRCVFLFLSTYIITCVMAQRKEMKSFEFRFC